MKLVITYYRNLTRWDVKSFLHSLKSVFDIEELGEYIYEHSEKENIFKEKEKEFPILGVTNKEGVYLNIYKKGRNINQSYKKVKKGELVYNPYRINVGSIGIVPDAYNNFYISPAYVIFGTKEMLLNKYLYLILSSDWFNSILRASTSGSVRQNLTYDLLASLKIPIPPITVQKQIVSDYYFSKEKAEKLQKEANEQEKQIDDYLLDELGIEKKKNKKRRGAFVVNFKDCERWGVDFNSYNWTLDDLLFSSIFKLKKISQVANVNPTYEFSQIDKEKEISFIPMEFVSDKTGHIEKTEKRILKKVFSGYTKFKEGNLLFAKITPCMQNGKCAIAKNLKNGIGVGSTEFHVLKINSEEIKVEFLWNILLLCYLRKSAQRFFIGSAGQQRVPDIFLKNLKIPIPPLPKQKQLVEQIEKIRENIKQKREESKQLLQEAKDKVEKMILS